MTWLKMDRRGAADRRNYCRIHTGSAQAIPAEEYVSGTKSREASMNTAIRRAWRKIKALNMGANSARNLSIGCEGA